MLPATDPLGREHPAAFLNSIRHGNSVLGLAAYAPTTNHMLPAARFTKIREATEVTEELAVAIAQELSKKGILLSGSFVNLSVRMMAANDSEPLVYGLYGSLLGFHGDSKGDPEGSSPEDQILLAVWIPSLQSMCVVPYNHMHLQGQEGLKASH